jgi:hypothetical protein
VSAPLILLDTSSSMALPVGSRRRIDVLAEILASVLPATPAVRLFSFNSAVTELDNAVSEHGIHLPEPDGSTGLDHAIEHIASLHPNPLIVISDGEPDDARAALDAAGGLNCVIQTFYCGDESNRAAIAFLRDLALCSRGGVGRLRIGNLAKPEQVATDLRPLLAGPAR